MATDGPLPGWILEAPGDLAPAPRPLAPELATIRAMSDAPRPGSAASNAAKVSAASTAPAAPAASDAASTAAAAAPAVLVLLAHPDLGRSRVNRALAQVAGGLPGVEVRDLYARYPDYLIDVAAEQQALSAARALVWLHPVQWYAMPALMKLWLDEVLAQGWAYGPGGTALAGKTLWPVLSTGSPHGAWQAGGPHGRPFADFLAPAEATAALCGLRWQAPLVLHGAHEVGPDALAAHVRRFSDGLRELATTTATTAATAITTTTATTSASASASASAA